jgi:prevent-host-death family protein
VTTTVNVHEAKTHFSRLLNRAAAGEEIIIAKGGKPFALLVPLRATVQTRMPGSARGAVEIRADFDDALPEDLQAGFTG